MPETHVEPDALLGKALGQYEIDSLLGAGAASYVFRARHRLLHRTVAVKVFRHEEVGRRPEIFEREAKTLGQLHHKHIIQVHDATVVGTFALIAMELAEGGSLESRLQREGVFPVKEVPRIAAQVLKALDYVHAKGIIHRDLKPANILITGDGQTKVADFGLVKLLEATTTDAPRGTPGYMSPEQLRGQAADARSDLYALGATLYALLAGRPPFEGDTPKDLLPVVMGGAPPPLSDRRRDLPGELVSFVNRLLEADPDARFASARDALRPLAPKTKRRHAAVRPPSPPTPATPAAKAEPKPEPPVDERIRTIVCPKCSMGFRTGRLHRFKCPNDSCGHTWKATAPTDLDAYRADRRVATPVFLVTRGPDQGVSFDLPEGPFFAGRHARSAVRLTDPSVAVRHASFARENMNVTIDRADCAPGLLVNGRPPTNAPLGVGDVLSLGDTCLVLQLRFRPRAAGDAARESLASLAGKERLTLNVDGKPATGFPLDQRRITIGRGRSRHVQLLHQAVSRKHAVITRKPDGVHLVDTASRTGTFLNGESVIDAMIAPEDEIQIGPYLLLYTDERIEWLVDFTTG